MRTRRACILSALTLASALIIGPSTASAASTPGQRLANQCAQCHGTNGSGGFKVLAGMSASAIYKQLIGMKSRATPQGIMDWQARGYTDQELWLISEYFSQQSRTGSTTCSPRNKC